MRDLLRAFLKHGHKSRKKAIMNTLKQLSLSLKIEKKNQSLPLRASIAPEFLLLICCPLGLQKIGFPLAGSTQLPPDLLGRGRCANLIPSGILLATTGQGYLQSPLTPLVNGHGCLVLVMRKFVSKWTTPPCKGLDECPSLTSTCHIPLSLAPPALMVIERSDVL